MKSIGLAYAATILAAWMLPAHATVDESAPPPDLLEFGRRIESEHAQKKFRALTHQFDLRAFEGRMLANFPAGSRETPEVAAQIDFALGEYQSDTWALRLEGTQCRFVHCRKADDHWRLVFRYTGPQPGSWAFFEYFVHPGEFYPWEIFDFKNYVNGVLMSELAVAMGRLAPEFGKLAATLAGADKEEQEEWMMANLAALSSGTRAGDWPKVLAALDRLPASLQADPFILQTRLLGFSHTENHRAYMDLYRKLRADFPARDLGEMSVLAALLDAGELGEAETILAKLRREVGGDRSLDFLGAQLASLRGDEDEAIRLLRGLVAAEPELYLGYLGLIPRLEDEAERKTLLAEVEKRFGVETAEELATSGESSPNDILKLLQDAQNSAAGTEDQNLADFVKNFENRMKHIPKPLELTDHNCAFDVWPGEPWKTMRDVEPEPGGSYVAIARRPADNAAIGLMRQQNSSPVYLDGSAQERFFIAGLAAAQRADGAEIVEQEKTNLAGQPCVRVHARQKTGNIENHLHGWFFALGERTLAVIVSARQLERLEDDPELLRIVQSFRFLQPEAIPAPALKRELPKTARADFALWQCAFAHWPQAGWERVIDEPISHGLNEGVELWTLGGSLREADSLAVTCNALRDQQFTRDAFANPVQRSILTTVLRNQSRQEGKTIKATEERSLAGRTGLELRTVADDGSGFSRIILVPDDGRLFYLIVEAPTLAALDDPQVEQWIASFEFLGERREGDAPDSKKAPSTRKR